MAIFKVYFTMKMTRIIEILKEYDSGRETGDITSKSGKVLQNKLE
jgi:hypothetical protein